jgi:hypothetical protein
MGFEDVVEQFHVQLVIFDDQYALGCGVRWLFCSQHGSMFGISSGPRAREEQ